MKPQSLVWVLLVSLVLLVGVVSADDPWATFVPSNISGTAPYTVTFVSISYNDPTAWNWSWRDVTGYNTEYWFNQSENATYTFNYAGNYAIRLNASNIDGYNITPDLVFVNVTGPAQPAPVASFFGYPTSGLSPLVVQFTDLSTNSPTSGEWYFWDNETVSNTTANPSQTFTTGKYNVRLHVRNIYGESWRNESEYIRAYTTHVSEAQSEYATGNDTIYAAIALLFVVVLIIGITIAVTYLRDINRGITPDITLVVAFIIGVLILTMIYLMMPALASIVEV